MQVIKISRIKTESKVKKESLEVINPKNITSPVLTKVIDKLNSIPELTGTIEVLSRADEVAIRINRNLTSNYEQVKASVIDALKSLKVTSWNIDADDMYLIAFMPTGGASDYDESKVKKEAEDDVAAFLASFNEQVAADNLARLASDATGMPIQMEVNHEMYRDPGTFNVTSNDLAPVMKPKMFKTLKILGSALKPRMIDGQMCYWVDLRYRYEHLDSGSNGCAIADVLIGVDGNIINKRMAY